VNRNIVEAVGLALAALGWGVICGAAALISVPLCVLLAGIGLLFTGGLAAYAANAKPTERPRT
jgi:hypothetical protein